MKRKGLLCFARNDNRVKIIYCLFFVLGGLSFSSAWAWTVPLESNHNALFQPSASQEFAMDPELSEEISVPEPLPQIKPRLAEQNTRGEAAPSVLALPGENTFNQPSLESKNSRGFKKQPSHLTGEEQVTLNYAQALECINKGMNDRAKRLLLDNLAILPNHLVSRIELANFYLKADQDSDAEQVVKEGLTHQQHPEFLKLMAVVMERRGELTSALGYLNKVPPQHKNDKNTVVLLGHVYQQTGHFSFAKKQYDRLLEAEPNNPLWLLGATMALEGQGKKREALKNYLQLQNNPGLDSALSQYVTERIAALKG